MLKNLIKKLFFILFFSLLLGIFNKPVFAGCSGAYWWALTLQNVEQVVVPEEVVVEKNTATQFHHLANTVLSVRTIQLAFIAKVQPAVNV